MSQIEPIYLYIMYIIYIYIYIYVMNDVRNPCGQCKVPGNDYSIIENPNLKGGLINLQ